MSDVIKTHVTLAPIRGTHTTQTGLACRWIDNHRRSRSDVARMLSLAQSNTLACCRPRKLSAEVCNDPAAGLRVEGRATAQRDQGDGRQQKNELSRQHPNELSAPQARREHSGHVSHIRPSSFPKSQRVESGHGRRGRATRRLACPPPCRRWRSRDCRHGVHQDAQKSG